MVLVQICENYKQSFSTQPQDALVNNHCTTRLAGELKSQETVKKPNFRNLFASTKATTQKNPGAGFLEDIVNITKRIMDMVHICVELERMHASHVSASPSTGT